MKFEAPARQLRGAQGELKRRQVRRVISPAALGTHPRLPDAIDGVALPPSSRALAARRRAIVFGRTG
jgi:hypothetical protein